MNGPGGTPGGTGTFFLGLALAGIGFYMFFSRVTVEMHGFRLWGYDASGGILVLFIIGLACLFYNGKSVAGWILTGASIAGLALYLILNLNFHFLSTNLTVLLIMLGLIGAGTGLILRAIRPRPEKT